MDANPPPANDPPTGPLMEAGAQLAARLIVELRAVFARERAHRFGLVLLRYLFRHYLRPAEAALRRAIYLLADTLPPPAPAASHAPRPAAGIRLGSAGPDFPRTPVFRLTEPPPRPSTHYIPASRRPRISVPGLTPAAPVPAPRKPADPVALEDRLWRRIEAFEAAWHNPDRAAHRLLRFLHRKRPQRPVLAFTAIPGLKAGPLSPPDRTLLNDMNTAILTAFRRGADTS